MKKFGLTLTVVVVIGILVLTGYLHDFITLTGGKTLYSADCAGGVWRGTTCTGRLVAGDRYHFKTLKPHGEVLYWVAGSKSPSGKLSECTIVNAREWACQRDPAGPAPITHAMKNGQPVAIGTRAPTRHCVQKWKWLMLSQGASFFHEADT